MSGEPLNRAAKLYVSRAGWLLHPCACAATAVRPWPDLAEAGLARAEEYSEPGQRGQAAATWH